MTATLHWACAHNSSSSSKGRSLFNSPLMIFTVTIQKALRHIRWGYMWWDIKSIHIYILAFDVVFWPLAYYEEASAELSHLTFHMLIARANFDCLTLRLRQLLRWHHVGLEITGSQQSGQRSRRSWVQMSVAHTFRFSLSSCFVFCWYLQRDVKEIKDGAEDYLSCLQSSSRNTPPLGHHYCRAETQFQFLKLDQVVNFVFSASSYTLT